MRPAIPTSIRRAGPGGLGSTAVTPYRNNYTRVDGLLKAGKTAIGEITDGTSNTFMIAEDAGRDARYIANAKTRRQLDLPAGPAVDNGLPRRFWTWAEPDGAFGVSGGINNKFRPSRELSPVPAAGLADAATTTPATTTRSSRSTPAAPTCSSATAASSS